MFSKARFILLLVAPGCFGAAPVIGVVTARGHFILDRSEMWGNSTLFDGGTLETRSASSEAILSNGVRIQLGSASSANVRENRLTLLKGTGQIAAPGAYEVNAGALSIRSASGAGRMRVSFSPDGRIEVASLAGATRVANSSGAVLAAIPEGRSLAFAAQAGVSAVTRTGCLLYKDGRFLIQDQETQEIIEVTGVNLAANVGNRVNVTGTASSAPPGLAIATSVLNATNVTLQAAGGCLSAAVTLDAQTTVPGGATPAPNAPAAPPGPAPKRGMSTGAKVAIAGAVAGGGAGAAIALAGNKKSTSP